MTLRVIAAVAGMMILSAILGRDRFPKNDSQPARSSSIRAEASRTVLHGRITDDEGRPIPGVKLTLYSGMATRFKGQEAVTDDDGRYRFDPLATGNPGREAMSTGLRLSHSDWVSPDGANWWEVEVANGKTVERNFKLTRGGRIEGTLVFSGGDWALRDFDVRVLGEGNRSTDYATTDGKGKFITEALARGEYRIEWNSPMADYPTLATVRVVPGDTTRFKVRCTFSVKVERLE